MLQQELKEAVRAVTKSSLNYLNSQEPNRESIEGTIFRAIKLKDEVYSFYTPVIKEHEKRLAEQVGYQRKDIGELDVAIQRCEQVLVAIAVEENKAAAQKKAQDDKAEREAEALREKKEAVLAAVPPTDNDSVLTGITEQKEQKSEPNVKLSSNPVVLEPKPAPKKKRGRPRKKK